MSDWRSELKLFGYYYYNNRNEKCWHLIASFFEDVMKSKPPNLINFKVPRYVYSLIISDLAHLAINDPYDLYSEEYAEYLLAFIEHPSKGYSSKYSFDYEAYTVEERERRIEKVKETERLRKLRIKKEIEDKRREILERKRKANLERQIRAFRYSSSSDTDLSDIQILQKYATSENRTIQIAEFKDREKKRRELLKSNQERFHKILRKLISEAKHNNSVDLKAFAIQNNFDLNEVLEIAKLSESIGLIETIDDKADESESTQKIGVN
jgi:hypothetical protein